MTDIAALLWMELGAVEILIFQCRAEHQTVTGRRHCVGTQSGIVAVDEIGVGSAVNALEQLALEI